MSPLEILTSAVASSHGIEVLHDDPELVKRTLYAERASLRKKGYTDFDNLTFRTSPNNTLWVIPKNATTEESSDE